MGTNSEGASYQASPLRIRPAESLLETTQNMIIKTCPTVSCRPHTSSQCLPSFYELGRSHSTFADKPDTSNSGECPCYVLRYCSSHFIVYHKYVLTSNTTSFFLLVDTHINPSTPPTSDSHSCHSHPAADYSNASNPAAPIAHPHSDPKAKASQEKEDSAKSWIAFDLVHDPD